MCPHSPLPTTTWSGCPGCSPSADLMPARPRTHPDPRRERAATPRRSVDNPNKPTKSIETPENRGTNRNHDRAPARIEPLARPCTPLTARGQSGSITPTRRGSWGSGNAPAARERSSPPAAIHRALRVQGHSHAARGFLEGRGRGSERKGIVAMKTLKIGIADYDRMKARTMAIARGEQQARPHDGRELR